MALWFSHYHLLLKPLSIGVTKWLLLLRITLIMVVIIYIYGITYNSVDFDNMVDLKSRVISK